MWVLLVTAVFAGLLVVVAILFKIADAIEYVWKLRQERRLLDRLWEDEELLDEYRAAGFLIRRPR